jgi:hypothetical protein
MADIKDTIPLEHNRNLEDLKKDISHFDPNNSVLLLIYFTKEGEGLKYYYRTYVMTKDSLWAGIGKDTTIPDLVAWDEPPDSEYPPINDLPVDRPTKKGKVNIKSLNVRNSPSLNGTKKLTTLTLGQLIEYYTDKFYPEAMNNTIIWAEIKTIDSKPVVNEFKWFALKYVS